MNIENIQQPFIKKFPGDFSGNPYRETLQSFISTIKPVGFDKPELIAFNENFRRNRIWKI
jgi:hypothetical protein